MMRPVVDREEWLEARLALLEKEKAHSRAQDALAAERRALPWVEVSTPYTFADRSGPVTLADLFEGRSQLLVYHFMFGPDWEAGCKSCSLVTDHLQGTLEHLHARDVSLVIVSRAPLDKLLAYRERMGWRHRWVSSLGTSFNEDFGVTIRPDDHGRATYNYREGAWKAPAETPGLSVFSREGSRVFHTYSTYARGLDPFITTYTLLDQVPKGRDEQGLEYTMAWVRRHDEY